ncbi:UbiA prenyltransferase family protein [Ochrovirga pacifica]|uniref:hypothetical protein n=1 Tax=Ochrovirga pacifica TaxID=1042376 RepID=UPI0002557F77|nr:hypothetical protein [Ochrovirga pacifica]
MLFIQRLIQFYVNSNLHVSFAVASWVGVTGILFQKDVRIEALFLFLLTFVAYHFVRFFNRDKYGKTHLLDPFSNQYLPSIITLLCLFVLGIIYLLLKLPLVRWLKLVPFGLLTVLYGIGIIKINGKRTSIRYIAGLKIFVIALVWAGVTVFFILPYSLKSVLYFVQVFFSVVVLTLPFDIRDIQFDKGKIKTLPMIFGMKKTKILATLLMLLANLIHYFIFRRVGWLPFGLFSILLLFLLWKSGKNQSRYYASFWVEGLPILYLTLSFLCM